MNRNGYMGSQVGRKVEGERETGYRGEGEKKEGEGEAL